MSRVPMTEPEDFELANKAFALFTLDQKRLALEKFAVLRYRSIPARFFDAVDYVIRETRAPKVQP